MTRRFLVTSALPYANGRLHVGHIAGAYLPADIYVRYLRARGDEVRFVCGSDDNGVASLISADKENTTPEELTARYNRRQHADFEGLGIRFDIYGGTHQPGFTELHEQLSQELFLSLHERGYFEKKETEQLYDVQAEQFLPDRFVKGACYECGYDGAYGDQCESCGILVDSLRLVDPVSTITGTTPEPRKTVHWYLQLDQLGDRLDEWLESKREPEDGPAWRNLVLNFALGQVRQGLPQRAMTRDLQWGVPVPLDDPDAEGKVLYVWFDAPIGYVSFTAKLCQQLDGDWQQYERWWKSPDSKIVHFIGEDNTVFHAITWPAMLMAEGSYELPWQVVTNAFLNIRFPGQEQEKISKSRGAAVWIEDYLQRFDPDPLRYYLTSVAPETQRTTFDLDEFVTRNNGELLAALGNFINRTLTFAGRYFEGKVPDVGERGAKDEKQLETVREQVRRTTEQLEALRFRNALAEMMALARAGNGYLETKAPWRQRKEDLVACGTTINVAVQTVKALATIMAPFLPFSAVRCVEMLQLDSPALPWDGATAELPAGHALGKPVILFERLEAETLTE